MKSLVALVLALAGFGDQCRLDAQQRPVTPEDILGIRQLDSDLQLSRDGKHIAFAVRERQRSNIWTVAVDGSAPPKRLASSTDSDFSPRWSPDSHSLSFLSRGPRVGGATADQLYLVTSADRPAVRLTSAPGGVQRFAWSPDGTEIAFAAGPGVTVLRVATRQADPVPGLTFTVREFAWSPDGREFATTYAPTPDSVGLTLLIVDRATGTIVRTLSEDVADIPAQLRWSPDGTLVTFAENSASKLGTWLAVVPATGGRPVGILKDAPLTVWQVEWMPDSKRVIALVVQGTSIQLETVDVGTGAVVRLADVIQSQAGYGFSTNGVTTAFLSQKPNAPDDVWVTTGPDNARQLTRLNPETASWSLGTVREVTWRSTIDGGTIRGVLVAPRGFVAGHRYPMIVEGHPGDLPWWPGWLAGWWSWGQLLASRGYLVFLPNYRGVAGEGWRRHERIGDWGGAAYQDLIDGVDELVRQGIADSTRLGIGGWSNGGFMTEWVITHTTRFKAAVAKSAHSNFASLYGTSASNRPYLRLAFGGSPADRREAYEAHSPITFVRQVRTPTLLVYGSDDSVSPSQGEEFHAALRRQGVTSELVIYPREGHGLGSREHRLDFQRRLVAWFDTYLRARRSALGARHSAPGR